MIAGRLVAQRLMQTIAVIEHFNDFECSGLLVSGLSAVTSGMRYTEKNAPQNQKKKNT